MAPLAVAVSTVRLEPVANTANVLVVAVVCDSVSLKVRMTFVPSVEVSGASLPLVTRVGRMPSTLWPLSAATAAWPRSASMVVEPALWIVPPLRVSLFAPTAMPSGAAWSSATVQANTRAAVPEPLS